MRSSRLHQRLLFDIESGQVLDGDRRYVMLRADVLMGAFDQMEGPARELALQTLGRSVTRFGSDSVRAYLAQVGPDALLQAMVENSASLGWGVWSFRREGRQLWLEVRNSPFAAGSTRDDAPSCHAIVGMLRATVAALWPEAARVRELRCVCQHRISSDHCLFLADPAPEP